MITKEQKINNLTTGIKLQVKKVIKEFRDNKKDALYKELEVLCDIHDIYLMSVDKIIKEESKNDLFIMGNRKAQSNATDAR